MAKKQRDAKGRFLPGNKEGISTDVAREYQLRSAEARKKNKTIAETLRAYLETDGGNGYTKGELLVMQAVKNHKDGKLTFHDLKDLADVLGEATLNIKTDGPQVVVVSQQAIQAADKWSKKK